MVDVSTILDRVVVMPRPSFCGRSCLLCTFTAADAATVTAVTTAAECSSNNQVRTMRPCQEKMDTGSGSCGGGCGCADARRVRTITESYHWYHSPLSIERSREKISILYTIPNI